MKAELSDMTRKRIEEAVSMSLTSQIGVFLSAEDALRKEMFSGGKGSIEARIFLGDLASIRLGLEFVAERLNAIRERI